MQPVLVLAPNLTPVPEVVAEARPVPEGAFLASFEADLPDAEVSVGSPVMLAIPVSPVIATAGAEHEEPEAGRTPATDTPLPGAISASAAVVADGAALPSAGVGLGAEVGKAGPVQAHQISEREPGEGQEVTARPAQPVWDGDPGVPESGPSDKDLASRWIVADAAGVTTRPRGDVDRLAVSPTSDVARSAPMERAEDVGRTLTLGAEVLRSSGPKVSEPTMTPARQGPKPEGPPVLPAPSGTGPEAASGGGDLRRATLHPVDPTPVSEPEISGPDTRSGAMPKVLTDAVGDRLSQRDGPGQAVPPQKPAAAEDAALPEVAEGPAPELPVKPIRAGLWESMFSSLALPLSAVGEVARTLRPVQTDQTEALLTVSIGRDATVLWMPDQPAADARVSQALSTAAPVLAIEMPKATAPIPAPAVALWPQELTWIMAADDANWATGDEGLPPLFSHGPIASGAVPSGHFAVTSLVSSPVPQVAPQIVAAMSRGADGATELALSPEELGNVRLRLEPDAANPDRMVVMITFERPETLDLFRRHAGELAEALRSAGYAGADIGFGQEGAGSGGFDHSDDRSANWSTGPEGIDPDVPHSPAPRLAAGASLDLRL